MERKEQPRIDEERLAKLAKMLLLSGAHDSPEAGMCAMEAAAWIAREPHSDHPKCVCPVIGAFVRRLNDRLPDDATRDELLKPLLPKLIGTKSTPEVERRRGWVAVDWLVRECLPAFLELTPSLREDATRLSSLPPVESRETAEAAKLSEVRERAWAARKESRAKLPYATAAAAATAGAAAYAADVAADAAVVATADAATYVWADELRPVVEKLQRSAVALLGRMCEVTA